MAKSILCNAFLMTIIVTSAVIYDIIVHGHGSLESSRIGCFLKYTGLLVHVKPYYTITEKVVVKWYIWATSLSHKDYELYKNKTLEFSKHVGKNVVQVSESMVNTVKKYTVISYEYVAAKIPPDFTEKTMNFLSDTYQFYRRNFLIMLDYIVEYTMKFKVWLLNNISKDTFTWDNMEKIYFEAAKEIGILYSDVTSWIGRKISCLVSA